TSRPSTRASRYRCLTWPTTTRLRRQLHNSRRLIPTLLRAHPESMTPTQQAVFLARAQAQANPVLQARQASVNRGVIDRQLHQMLASSLSGSQAFGRWREVGTSDAALLAGIRGHLQDSLASLASNAGQDLPYRRQQMAFYHRELADPNLLRKALNQQ